LEEKKIGLRGLGPAKSENSRGGRLNNLIKRDKDLIVSDEIIDRRVIYWKMIRRGQVREEGGALTEDLKNQNGVSFLVKKEHTTLNFRAAIGCKRE